MNSEFEKLEKEIAEVNQEIIRLNDECAVKLGQVAGNRKSRIMSYAEEQEINETVDTYTKQIAKLILDLEELEEVKRIYLAGKDAEEN